MRYYHLFFGGYVAYCIHGTWFLEVVQHPLVWVEGCFKVVCSISFLL